MTDRITEKLKISAKIFFYYLLLIPVQVYSQQSTTSAPGIAGSCEDKLKIVAQKFREVKSIADQCTQNKDEQLQKFKNEIVKLNEELQKPKNNSNNVECSTMKAILEKNRSFQMELELAGIKDNNERTKRLQQYEIEDNARIDEEIATYEALSSKELDELMGEKNNLVMKKNTLREQISKQEVQDMNKAKQEVENLQDQISQVGKKIDALGVLQEKKITFLQQQQKENLFKRISYEKYEQNLKDQMALEIERQNSKQVVEAQEKANKLKELENFKMQSEKRYNSVRNYYSNFYTDNQKEYLKWYYSERPDLKAPLWPMLYVANSNELANYDLKIKDIQQYEKSLAMVKYLGIFSRDELEALKYVAFNFEDKNKSDFHLRNIHNRLSAINPESYDNKQKKTPVKIPDSIKDALANGKVKKEFIEFKINQLQTLKTQLQAQLSEQNNDAGKESQLKLDISKLDLVISKFTQEGALEKFFVDKKLEVPPPPPNKLPPVTLKAHQDGQYFAKSETQQPSFMDQIKARNKEVE